MYNVPRGDTMLGENIRNLRKENKMSQEELAEKLNVSRQSVSLWETEKTQPTLEIVSKLAELFDVSTDELLTGDRMFISNDNKECAVKKSVKAKKYITVCIAVSLIILLAILLIVNISVNNFSENPKAIEETSKSVVLLNCYDKKGGVYSARR